MAYIEAFWLLWLAIAIVGYGYVIYNQLHRMKGMVDANADPFKAFFSGIVPLIVVGLLSSGSGMLFVISMVIKIIRYATGGE